MALPNRYHRQQLLPDIGEEGQARLARAHAAIIGVGALGTTSAQMLARAGVGTITLIDRDTVEPTNLQRQTLFTEAHALAGMPKAAAAKEALEQINSEIEIRAHASDFNHTNASHLLGLKIDGGEASGPNVLVDGTDNLYTRYLLNDLSIREGIPYCYAGAVATNGMLMSVLPGNPPAPPETPCLRCVFPELPEPGTMPTCDTAGVLGPVVSAVASLQAVEVIKILLGRTDLVIRTMRTFDPWAGESKEIDLSGARDPGCPCCSERRFEFADGSREMPGASLCGRNAVQILPASPGSQLELDAMGERLRSAGEVTVSRFIVRCVLRDEPYELSVFRDGRAIVSGTDDEARARSVYAKYIGA